MPSVACRFDDIILTPEFLADPYAVYHRMRDEAPVYRNDKHDFYALTRFADVEAAHRDPQTFSSARGTVLEIMGPDLSRTGQMIFLDPPEHTTLRQLVSRAFTPRRVSELEGRVRELCAELLDPFADLELLLLLVTNPAHPFRKGTHTTRTIKMVLADIWLLRISGSWF